MRLLQSGYEPEPISQLRAEHLVLDAKPTAAGRFDSDFDFSDSTTRISSYFDSYVFLCSGEAVWKMKQKHVEDTTRFASRRRLVFSS